MWLFACLLGLVPLNILGHHIIKGKVLDENKSPLPGATVLVKGSTEGTSTDDWGYFTLETELTSGKLIVSYIGFATVEIDFDAHGDPLTITLKSTIVDLKDVNINESRITPMESIATVDVNVRSVNTSQDVLRVVPGLFIAQHAGGGKSEQMFLRGFDTDHGTDVRVTVDGLPVNMVSQAHGQGYADLHWLIPELIHEVDFGKGTYYSQQGDFATSAYINFKTLNFLNNNLIKMEIAQFNTLRTVGMFNILSEAARQDGKNAFFAVEYSTSDGPFENPQNFNRVNIFGKYSQRIDQKNMITLTATIFSSGWDQSGQVPQEAIDDDLITRWGSLDPTEGGATSRYNLMAKSVHQLKNDGVFKNFLYYTRYTFDLFSNFTFYLDDMVNGDQIKQAETRNLLGYEGEYFNSYTFSNENVIQTKFGGGIRYDNILNSQLLNTAQRYQVIDTSNFGNINQANSNLYAEITWLKSKWVADFALRFDFFTWEYLNKMPDIPVKSTNDQALLSPKLNLMFNATKNFQLYFKAGQGYHSNDARVATQNDSLQPLARALGADVGINCKPASRFIVNAAVWYMYLESELVWSGDAGTWEPSGKTKRYGIDLSLRWQLLSWLFFDADVNYSIARFIDEPKGADYVPLAPVWTSAGGLTFNHPTGWSSSLRYRYMSDRPADEINLVQALGYLIFDINLNYTYYKWTFGVAVENLLNSDWNEAQFAGDYRITQTAEPGYGLTFTPGTPFFFKTVVTFRF